LKKKKTFALVDAQKKEKGKKLRASMGGGGRGLNASKGTLIPRIPGKEKPTKGLGHRPLHPLFLSAIIRLEPLFLSTKRISRNFQNIFLEDFFVNLALLEPDHEGGFLTSLVSPPSEALPLCRAFHFKS